MELELEDKVVLITGSSQGIGKSIAEYFNDEGSKIILNSRTESKLKKVSNSINNSDYFTADVTKEKECKKLIKYISKNYSKLDILVCNVGNGQSVMTGKETYDEWHKMFEINFHSTINIINASKDLLKKSHGVIVCISSIAGIEITGAPITYSVAKAALNFYVKVISKEFGKYNVRINAVAPGNILFSNSTWEKKLLQNKKQIMNIIEKEVALKRFGKPEEIANIVVFLSSKRSSFITGTTIVIDGGQICSIV